MPATALTTDDVTLLSPAQVSRLPFYTVDLSILATVPLAKQIQDIHDALPGISGGTLSAVIVIPQDTTGSGFVWDRTVTLTKPIHLMSFAHAGGGVRNAGTNPSSCVIRLTSAVVDAIKIGNGSAIFAGVSLSNLVFVGNSSPTAPQTAIHVNAVSHCKFNNLTISQFKTGFGFVFEGNAGQYSRINDCFVHETQIGIQIDNYNGIIVDGCYFDPANNGTNIPAGSKGIFVRTTDADTLKVVNSQFQGCDICIDSVGEAMSIQDCRFEIFNTGVRLAGKGQHLGGGNSFNNSIRGSAIGQAVLIDTTANQCVVHPITYGSVATEPILDNGVATQAKFAYELRTVFGQADSTGKQQTLNVATQEWFIGSIPQDAHQAPAGNVLVRRLKFICNTTLPVSSTDYYTFNVRRGTATLFSVSTLTTGITARVAVDFPSLGTTAINAGDMLTVQIVKTGTPPPLDFPQISLLFAPR